MKAPPNILFVHCHDLGRFLNCYGVQTVRTPRIDAFAAQGLLLENCFCSAPQCSPSRASMFTGRYPHSTGMLGMAHGEFAWELNEDEKHIGQLLQQAGYVTEGIGVLHETQSGHKRCGLERYEPVSRAVQATDATIARLKQLRNGHQPFYLQLGYFEPHRLSGVPDRDMGFVTNSFPADDSLGVQVPGYLSDTDGTRTELAELQGAVRHVDEQFGRILDALDDLDLRQNTLVVFTTDHGVAMPRAKMSLYDPGIEIASLWRLPGCPGWREGRRLSPMISNIDYVPTLLELAGQNLPENLQGRSFKPLVECDTYNANKCVFSQLSYHGRYNPIRSVRTNTHKLIVNFSSGPAFQDASQSWRPRAITVVPRNPSTSYRPLLELYELESDPWEHMNVADNTEYRAVKRYLLRTLYRHMIDTDDPLLQGPVPSPAHQLAMAALTE